MPATFPLYFAMSSSPSPKSNATGHSIGRPFSKCLTSSELHSKIFRPGIPISISIIFDIKFSIDRSSRSDKSVALIIKKYAEKAGLDQTKYAGHSLRSGFATTAAEFGADGCFYYRLFYQY